jgi:predicted PhzF superfamily epimerase YddE/YHI9
VRDCAPEFGALKKICDKLIITARGSGETDFVSRFFAPGLGIDEDPVTGSAHSQLIPFWSRRLDKRQLNARQLSGRGGHLVCEQLNDERVLMKGQAVFYLEGTVYLP